MPHPFADCPRPLITVKFVRVFAVSALTLLVGRQEAHLACKN